MKQLPSFLYVLVIALIPLFPGCTAVQKTEQATTINSTMEFTEETKSSDKVNYQKIQMNGISYNIPADFETMGKDNSKILRHNSPNGDNLLVSCLGDYDSANMKFNEKHVELGILASDFVEQSGGTKTDTNFGFMSQPIPCCRTEYYTDDYYAIAYHFFLNNKAYCMSYSSKEPITTDNEEIFKNIAESVQ